MSSVLIQASSTKLTNGIVANPTTLCLACSASLPPSTFKSADFTLLPSKTGKLFITPCCERPICARCITLNPRLARYDPCLACLGGVDVIGHRFKGVSLKSDKAKRSPNLDGAIREEDTFVLGDDEDDDELDFHAQHSGVILKNQGDGPDSLIENPFLQPPPPPYTSLASTRSVDRASTRSTFSIGSQVRPPQMGAPKPPEPDGAPSETASLNADDIPAPQKYFIDKNDTLQGIVLRYRLDANKVCKMNNLPPSALRTNPHLLHTRRFILLPPSASLPSSSKSSPQSSVSPEQQKALEQLHTRERAAKRLQTLTKEVDWDVAKAYVAIADDPELSRLDQEEREWKRKEGEGKPLKPSDNSLGSRAVEQYLEDAEWEEEQRRALAKAASSSGFLGKMRGGGWWQQGK